jgi:hypothetical protein
MTPCQARLRLDPQFRRPPRQSCPKRITATNGGIGKATVVSNTHHASSAAADAKAQPQAVFAVQTLSEKRKHTFGGWRKRPDLKQGYMSLVTTQHRYHSDQGRELLQRRSVRVCDCEIGAVYENDEPIKANPAP